MTATSVPTTPIYLRIPVALRAKLDAAAKGKSGYVRKGDLASMVIEALEAGLEKIAPVCGAQSGESFCLLPRGHREDISSAGTTNHSDGTRTWPEPRMRPLVRARRAGGAGKRRGKR